MNSSPPPTATLFVRVCGYATSHATAFQPPVEFSHLMATYQLAIPCRTWLGVAKVGKAGKSHVHGGKPAFVDGIALAMQWSLPATEQSTLLFELDAAKQDLRFSLLAPAVRV